MPNFILRVSAPTAPKKQVEIMIKGATVDEALKGTTVEVFNQKRMVEEHEFKSKPGQFYTFVYYRRQIMKFFKLDNIL
jgi:hypothetical protein